MQSNTIWTISNGLSIFRLILTIPASIFILNNNVTLVIIIGLIAFLSDLSDGWIARKMNQQTEFGKIIDPLADKIFMGTIVVMLVIVGDLPLWLVVAVITRDILILIGGLYAKSRLGYVIPSNMTGKITMDVLIITVSGAFLKIPYIMDYGPYVSLVFLIISFIHYIINGVKLIKNITV